MKDTVAEVVELECCKLSASRAAVCCETHEQAVLLGEMPVLTIARTSNVVCNGLEQLRLLRGVGRALRFRAAAAVWGVSVRAWSVSDVCR